MERTRCTTLIWSRLLVTVTDVDSNDRHLTAACNAINVFLQASCNSKEESIRGLGLSPSTWDACFDHVSSVYETGRVKAMRQIFVTLTSLLQSLPASVAAQTASLKATLLAKALDVTYSSRPRHKLKASMVLTEMLVRKVMSLDEFIVEIANARTRNAQSWTRKLAADNMPSSVVLNSGQYEDWTGFVHGESHEVLSYVLTLWHTTIFTDLSPTSVSLFEAFSQKLASSRLHCSLFKSLPDTAPPWVTLLCEVLSRVPESVNTLSIHLFPKLLKVDPNGYRRLSLIDTGSSSEDAFAEPHRLLTRLAAIQVGRQASLFSQSDVLGNTSDGGPFSVMELLSHRDADIRARAFSTIVSSARTTEVLDTETLTAILNNFPYIYGDADSNNRGEILATTRRLIIRLKASSKNQKVHTLGLQAEYVKFFSVFATMLEEEIGPTCPYQRHICALKVLEVLLASGIDSKLSMIHRTRLGNDQTDFDFEISLHSRSLISTLLNLTMNPFQDVRASAACILLSYDKFLNFGSTEARDTNRAEEPTTGELENQHQLSTSDSSVIMGPVLHRAEQQAMRSHRADHADGLGRLYALQFTMTKTNEAKLALAYGLVSRVEVALETSNKTSQFKAPVAGVPLHGLLVGLR